jgi:mannose/fructose/N-acetylgalactosamine-specific phosphotransferase system component IID
MAAKTPDSTETYNLGSLKLTIANFTTTDIDDDDTWASGIVGYIGSIWAGIGDNCFDVQITSVSAAGAFVFDSAGSMTGKLLVFSVSD